MHMLFDICRVALSLTALAAFPLAVQANGADASRIVEVKVYPGVAEVSRVGTLNAGSQHFTFACLPAGLDAESIRISSDVPVDIGEITLRSEPRAFHPECRTSALDGRIRELEDRKAQLAAELESLGYVTEILRGMKPDANAVSGWVGQVQRNGQSTLLRQHEIRRQQEALDAVLNPLLAERERSQGGVAGNVTILTVATSASRNAELRLDYRVNGPGWAPTYRALLDTRSGKVRIERRAQVAQASGEDWRGVKLTLSTTQPRRNTTAGTPGSWRFDIAEPVDRAANKDSVYMMASVPPAPAAPAAPSEMPRAAGAGGGAPLFEVGIFNTGFDTEFHPTRTLDVPSDGQRVSILLDTFESDARLVARTSPMQGALAYLMAYIKRPEGVWPRGSMQLYRDGTYAGSSQWQGEGQGELALSFGQDDLVRVTHLPDKDTRGQAGIGRMERRIERAFQVENRHPMPVAVEVLAATPQGSNDQIRIQTRLSPEQAEMDWNQQPGVVRWQKTLAAGERAEFSFQSVLNYPKDAHLVDY